MLKAENDQQADAAFDRSNKREAQLYGKIKKCNAESFGDVNSLLHLAIELIEDTSSSDLNREQALALIKKAREAMLLVIAANAERAQLKVA
jgi:hypothetical protein